MCIRDRSYTRPDQPAGPSACQTKRLVLGQTGRRVHLLSKPSVLPLGQTGPRGAVAEGQYSCCKHKDFMEICLYQEIRFSEYCDVSGDEKFTVLEDTDKRK